jgi:hypothetical protein
VVEVHCWPTFGAAAIEPETCKQTTSPSANRVAGLLTGDQEADESCALVTNAPVGRPADGTVFRTVALLMERGAIDSRVCFSAGKRSGSDSLVGCRRRWMIGSSVETVGSLSVRSHSSVDGTDGRLALGLGPRRCCEAAVGAG